LRLAQCGRRGRSGDLLDPGNRLSDRRRGFRSSSEEPMDQRGSGRCGGLRGPGGGEQRRGRWGGRRRWNLGRLGGRGGDRRYHGRGRGGNEGRDRLGLGGPSRRGRDGNDCGWLGTHGHRGRDRAGRRNLGCFDGGRYRCDRRRWRRGYIREGRRLGGNIHHRCGRGNLEHRRWGRRRRRKWGWWRR
jgi:hypothetical protein